jgi:hypothetical protein
VIAINKPWSGGKARVLGSSPVLLVRVSISLLAAGLFAMAGACGDDTAGPGGAGGAGGADGGGGAGGIAVIPCTFQVNAQVSPTMATVGIVTWSTDLKGVAAAHIDFGLDEGYGMSAPVDLAGADHRTLLLGMKQNRTYHYRIVAASARGGCISPDYTLTTGVLLNGLPRIIVLDKSKAATVYGGFLVAGQYLPVPPGGMPAYIADADGDLVWAYPHVRDATGVRMSYDGNYLWINSANVPSSQGAVVHRVAMDGSTDEDLSDRFAGLNHQLTVLPDETVAFFAYGESGCEDLKEYSPATGQVRTVVNAGAAQGGASACHLVNLEHSRVDDTLVFSDMQSQAVVKVRRGDGRTVWIVNGPHATFTGATWIGAQHSLHLLGVDRFMLFNNNTRRPTDGPLGTGDGSIVMELALDLEAKTVRQVWSYKAEPGIQNDVMGDVQRLPNGNTVVAFSTVGVLQEVAPDGTLLQEWTWPLGASFGYIEKRATLYGPPPR